MASVDGRLIAYRLESFGFVLDIPAIARIHPKVDSCLCIHHRKKRVALDQSR